MYFLELESLDLGQAKVCVCVHNGKRVENSVGEECVPRGSLNSQALPQPLLLTMSWAGDIHPAMELRPGQSKGTSQKRCVSRGGGVGTLLHSQER